MNSTLTDRDWENLLKKIGRGNCVPFLGAGACYGALPLGGDIAREWADQFHYPMSDTGDLVRVSQFLAVEYDLTYPKELVLERLGKCSPPNFRAPDEPHGVLADLPLKILPDDQLRRLHGPGPGEPLPRPQREFCRWNELIRKEPTLFDKEPTYEPTVARPLVYYLHGHTDPNSVVLTEDDYLTFLAAMQDPELLPDPVETGDRLLLAVVHRLPDGRLEHPGAAPGLATAGPGSERQGKPQRHGARPTRGARGHATEDAGLPGPLLRGDRPARVLGHGPRVLWRTGLALETTSTAVVMRQSIILDGVAAILLPWRIRYRSLGLTEVLPMSETISSPVSPVLKRSDALDEPKWKFLLSRIQRHAAPRSSGPRPVSTSRSPAPRSLPTSGPAFMPTRSRTGPISRVAQFVAYNAYGMVDAVKEELAEKFRGLKAPDFSNPDEPYRVLASLPMSVYINTHYYAFMTFALMSQYREPQRMICRWYENKPVDDGADLPAAYDPKPACPLVFHMFGHVAEPRSLVLTEDDYLDFLVRTSENPDLIPVPVQNAMTNHSLLFFGYQVTDLDFRVLLRSLNRIWQRAGTRQGSNYTTQLVHVGEKTVTSDQVTQIKKYFDQYCSACASVSIGVYWGSTNEFVTELHQRWEDYRVNSAIG